MTPDVVCPDTVGSEALAVIVVLPETVELLAGVVIETVGGVVSGDGDDAFTARVKEVACVVPPP